MQADAFKIYACDCTSHPINLWNPVSSVVTERKESRHLCHLSNPSHQSHPSHPSLQSHLIILVTPVDKGNLVTLAILVTQLTIR